MVNKDQGQDFEIPKNWTFENQQVADKFDAHVREELPWYDLITRAVIQISRNYIGQNGLIYDIGASTGNIGLALKSILESRNAQLIAVEKSEEMAKIYRGGGILLKKDASEIEYKDADLIICFLVLMFMTPEKKMQLIARLKSALKDGGALIIVDKRTHEAGYIGTILHRLTISEKVNAGVKPERIVEKELSLQGIQRPMRSVDMPQEAIEFFRFGEFSGWIIERNKWQ